MESELAALWEMFTDRGWASQNEWSPEDYKDASPLLKVFAWASFTKATGDEVIPRLQIIAVTSEGWSIGDPRVAGAFSRESTTVILEYLDHRDPALMKLTGGRMVLELRPKDVMVFLRAIRKSSRPSAATASP